MTNPPPYYYSHNRIVASDARRGIEREKGKRKRKRGGGKKGREGKEGISPSPAPSSFYILLEYSTPVWSKGEKKKKWIRTSTAPTLSIRSITLAVAA